VIPDALTLLALIMGATLIAIQVRLEEEFLRKTHGDEYARYSQRVRRWL
jgi:protein-S-isoprenylcysteine O-methyltransferase Ste14